MEAGLEEIYEIVPVGVEDLGDKWVGMGEVDTVVTVQCLCSVTEPERMIGGLYGYLREGGRWVVYEHVVVFGWQGVGVRLWQGMLYLIHYPSSELAGLGCEYGADVCSCY